MLPHAAPSLTCSPAPLPPSGERADVDQRAAAAPPDGAAGRGRDRQAAAGRGAGPSPAPHTRIHLSCTYMTICTTWRRRSEPCPSHTTHTLLLVRALPAPHPSPYSLHIRGLPYPLPPAPAAPAPPRPAPPRPALPRPPPRHPPLPPRRCKRRKTMCSIRYVWPAWMVKNSPVQAHQPLSCAACSTRYVWPAWMGRGRAHPGAPTPLLPGSHGLFHQRCRDLAAVNECLRRMAQAPATQHLLKGQKVRPT